MGDGFKKILLIKFMSSKVCEIVQNLSKMLMKLYFNVAWLVLIHNIWCFHAKKIVPKLFNPLAYGLKIQESWIGGT
jgi:hypothetical protein